MHENKLFESKFLVAHTSDLLRLMTLYRFGGIYMDLDVVMQKTFENVGLNFIAAESKLSLGNALMSFTQAGFGHEILLRCAR